MDNRKRLFWEKINRTMSDTRFERLKKEITEQFQQDNFLCHSSMKTMSKLQQLEFDMLIHSTQKNCCWEESSHKIYGNFWATNLEVILSNRQNHGDTRNI